MNIDLVVRRVSLAVVLLAVVTIVGTAAVLAVPGLRTRVVSQPEERSGYAVGEPVDVSPAPTAESGTAVLIFASSSCEACRKSQPGLAQVVVAARDAGVAVSLVTAAEQPESHNEFARAIGLPPSAVRRLDLSQLRLRAVPTVVVVSPSGVATYVHEGVVTDEYAFAAMAAVRRALRSGL